MQQRACAFTPLNRSQMTNHRHTPSSSNEMAGQAQKKAAKAASSTGRFYGFLLLVVNAVYCLWLASQALNGTDRWAAYKAWSLTRKVFVWGGGAFCYWYAYTGLVTSARLQTPTSTYVDLLGLTMLSQLGSVFWDGAWLLLLLVPVMAVASYLLPLFGMFSGAGGGGGAGGDGVDAAADAKRQAKKERKASRARIIR